MRFNRVPSRSEALVAWAVSREQTPDMKRPRQFGEALTIRSAESPYFGASSFFISSFFSIIFLCIMW